MSVDFNKVLVVDDEIELCRILVDEIEYNGFEARYALNGKEAVELLEEFPAFLVISDINMPQMSGIELLDFINQKSGDKAKVILCSGFSGYEEKSLKEKGALALLTKPYNFDALITLIKESR